MKKEEAIVVRPMRAEDRAAVLALMRVFYASPAVLSNGSEAIFARDFEACVGDCPFIEGYVLEYAGETAGYAMLAMGYTVEYGALCVWVEDLYVQPAYRGKGIAPAFLAFVKGKYPSAVLRLEVENENEHAVHVYQKHGFEPLAYTQMICYPQAPQKL